MEEWGAPYSEGKTTMKDFQGTVLHLGDRVAFGEFSGMLSDAIVTGSVSIGKTTLIELVQTLGDGTTRTLKEHSSKLCKLPS
jgi:hypothetical protein